MARSNSNTEIEETSNGSNGPQIQFIQIPEKQVVLEDIEEENYWNFSQT